MLSQYGAPVSVVASADAAEDFVTKVSAAVLGAAALCEILPLEVVKPEATYLLWIDISKLNISSTKLANKLENIGKIRIISGGTFGKNGDNFIRINIACPLKTLKDGLNRLKNGINQIKTLEN